MNIIKKPSPNFGQRAYKPELIVIHIMDGSLSGTDDWFITGSAEAGNPVSAHYGIGLNGEVHQYVEESQKAWHCGRTDKPSFKLYKPNINCNEYTIGIEHEGKDLANAPLFQLQASATLVREICGRWGIPIDRDHIIGHYQVFSQKPNCPATDKSVIDKIIKMAQPEVKLSKAEVIAKVTEIINNNL